MYENAQKGNPSSINVPLAQLSFVDPELKKELIGKLVEELTSKFSEHNIHITITFDQRKNSIVISNSNELVMGASAVGFTEEEAGSTSKKKKRS